MKRDECVNRIRAIHSLAVSCVNDRSLAPQLLCIIDDIDDIWTAFTTESEILIDCLRELDRDSEYSIDQVAELRALISFLRAVSRRFSSTTQVEESTFKYTTSLNDLHIDDVKSVRDVNIITSSTPHISPMGINIDASSSNDMAVSHGIASFGRGKMSARHKSEVIWAQAIKSQNKKRELFERDKAINALFHINLVG